jgi:hypothetical protein
MPSTSTPGEDKHNPGILLTSGLLHSFIQGIIVSQVGRYYEDYYHLDTLSMKLYAGSIVAVSLYVFHRRCPNRNPETHSTTLKRADDVHLLQSLGGYPPPRWSERRGGSHHLKSHHYDSDESGVGAIESLDGGRLVLERGPLRVMPYVPHQTVLESKPPVAVNKSRLTHSKGDQR